MVINFLLKKLLLRFSLLLLLLAIQKEGRLVIRLLKFGFNLGVFFVKTMIVVTKLWNWQKTRKKSAKITKEVKYVLKNLKIKVGRKTILEFDSISGSIQ